MVLWLHDQNNVLGRIRAYFAVVACAACHPTGGEPTDGDMTGSAGLVVTWSADPQIPGDLGPLGDPSNTTTVSVSRAQFRIDTLRIIGDAGPGDPRTTANNFLALWQHDENPSPISFMDAPIGLYSKVSLAIDGHLVNDSVEIDGTVQIAGTNHPFRIRDRNILPIALDTDQMLAPGDSIKIGLTVDLRKGFVELGPSEWANAKTDNGTLVLETVSGDINVLATLAKFEVGILGSFGLKDQSSHRTTGE